MIAEQEPHTTYSSAIRTAIGSVGSIKHPSRGHCEDRGKRYNRTAMNRYKKDPGEGDQGGWNATLAIPKKLRRRRQCEKSRDDVADRERKLLTESNGSREQRQRRQAAAAAIKRNVDGKSASEIRVEEVGSGRWEADN
ncbi:hypothetical protein BHE74_00033462 [Ensete ventricosum]|nr:hypothetical protein BHE74_00033462 [Ensete ventricosum]